MKRWLLGLLVLLCLVLMAAVASLLPPLEGDGRHKMP